MSQGTTGVSRVLAFQWSPLLELSWDQSQAGLYWSQKHIAASPVDVLSASFQASVHDTPPEECGRHMKRLLAAFAECPLASSRLCECLPPAMMSAHTATTTTVTTQRSTASAIEVAEAAADERMLVDGPQLTVVSPTAYTRSAYWSLSGHELAKTPWTS